MSERGVHNRENAQASAIAQGSGRGAFPLRFITATSIFDGHDVSINIIRRIMQDLGAEVVHLGHNRSVDEIVRAALQEDVDGIAVSSYQGGHSDFFRYLVDRLNEVGAGHIALFGGGGGTITAEEIAALEAYGVERIYTPEDGRRLGLEAMVGDLLSRTQRAATARHETESESITFATKVQQIAHCMSRIERGMADDSLSATVQDRQQAVVVGVTGTGGAGKSSLLDGLIASLLLQYPSLEIAVLAIDPTRHKSGGALLGDRIRLNSLGSERLYMRSMATRRRDHATSSALSKCIGYLQQQGFGVVFVETAGTGQADLEIIEHVDLSLYVMTDEYGAPTQLEKIQMLDFADIVVLNKFDRRGAQDALRDIRKQWKRDHKAFNLSDDQLPVYATVASRWDDNGIEVLCTALGRSMAEINPQFKPSAEVPAERDGVVTIAEKLIPSGRAHYLSEIAKCGREAAEHVEQQAHAASRAYSYYQSLKAVYDPSLPEPLSGYAKDWGDDGDDCDETLKRLRTQYDNVLALLDEKSLQLLRSWGERSSQVRQNKYSFSVRGREVSGENYVQSLSDLSIPKIALPCYEEWGELLRFLLKENLPGSFPFTAGVFPYRQSDESPARMFAGEGTPERTNRRFHYLAKGQASIRLSTAFDPITLYGEDVARRPDIYGRIGMSGVSIATLDDMKKLYSGFDLCASNTSVSMTINGPAPMLLAWFLNTAIDQQVEKVLRESGRWNEAEKKIETLFSGKQRPRYHGELPGGNNGLGLAMLGVTGDQLVDDAEYRQIKEKTLSIVRGTLQADILKEDQAQNECIFPLEFGLRLMADVQHYFITHQVNNYYSVSVSGYHIAEAGANPVTQLAFTLANGFTLVEYYQAQGMKVDDFAAQMSFFFSNGMDPEYAVIGRVARRIWARAMREVYRANERSQKLKYHIQTSGRTLHAQTLGFNDIRTTLQALYAIYDNCNSLHTNAYDEALTTPTEESVRRALAIQMIIDRELGLNFNQNTLQGSFIIDELTDLVEEAVYAEFDRLSERGGVLGAMETLYQRSKIQDESLRYEQGKHDGSLPIVGVNTFLEQSGDSGPASDTPLIRSSDDEKLGQIEALENFKRRHGERSQKETDRLKRCVNQGGNSFEVLMEASKWCSLGEMTEALCQVVGRYRRRI